jgi:tripartite-type tricarboxylate transporter receptor subunit TctC
MEGRSLLIRIVMVLLSLALCLGLTGSGGAQEKYPTREITFIIGTNPGGATDFCCRSLCKAASKILGQTIIVLNKPGAAYGVALVAVKNAKPDGYTIGELPSAPMNAQLIQKTVPYDFLKDFKFILQCYDWRHGIVVQKESPWKTIQELIAYGKNNPGKVRIGVLGVGGTQHIAMERLSIKIGVKFNIIPFGDAVTAMTNLLGGHVDAIATVGFLPNVEAGQVRLLAVSGGGDERMAQFPNIPTLMELYGINMPGFSTIGGPKGLPPHVVDTLHRAFKKSMEDPDFIETAKKFYIPIVYRGPEDLTEYIHKSFDMLADVIKKLGLRKE